MVMMLGPEEATNTIERRGRYHVLVAKKRELLTPHNLYLETEWM